MGSWQTGKNMQSDDFKDLSTTMFTAIQKLYGDFMDILPKKIESRSDLQRIDTETQRSGYKPQDLYRNAKSILINVEDCIDETIKNISDLDSIKVSADSEKLVDKYRDIRDFHKNVRYELEDLLWVEDDSLLSSIFFHSELADKTVYSITENELKENLSDEGKIKVEIDKTIKIAEDDRDIIKAMMILSVEPLLVWSALFAYIRNDYRFILRYETEVESSARAIRRSAPKERIKDIMRETA